MTEPRPIDIEKIKAHNWRQGCLFPQKAIQEIAARYFPDVDLAGVRLLVVSQSCDIAYYKTDEEPTIEVILIRPITSPDNAAIRGRRQRCYHLEAIDDAMGNSNWFEAGIDDRYRIDRGFCSDFPPCSELRLSADEIRGLVQWIVYRYVRPAFPDAFNERYHAKKNALKKLLKKEGTQYLTGIYLRVTDEELPKDVLYEVALLGTISKENYQDDAKRAIAVKHLLDIEAILGDCEGIEVFRECLSEEDISLDKFRQYRRFTEYDYLSYGSDDSLLLS